MSCSGNDALRDGGATFESQQHITLKGVDLAGAETLSDQDIFVSLLANGNLIVD
ncbi:type I secretion C-terminal target domain-containing protein [Zhongshania sp.]|uniref:type I secretion C-terminal target domain-containing protein n=1 Tax=Zhongshania sp. TaxID=1971902 RepID=UPI003562A54F